MKHGDNIDYDLFDIIGERPEWQHHAACNGLPVDWWFPERGQDTAAAKRVCNTCPVINNCATYAIDLSMRFGIWGGIAEKKRRLIKHTNHINRTGGAA